MYYVAHTNQLIADGIITTTQSDEIRARARAAMVALCVNTLLITGIIAASLGLVFYLGTAPSVAVCGGLFLAVGLLILRSAAPLYRMFGNASAMIGAGMLISGTGGELMDKFPDIAGQAMFGLGAMVAGLCLWRFKLALPHMRFAYGAAMVMGVAMHLAGVYAMTEHFGLWGWPMPFIHFYVFAAVVALGLLLDLRIVTAMAIVPFAQMLDTSTYYFSATYAFYSPESTLSILQMSALIGVCLWAASRWGSVVQRQAEILMIMAFIVGSLCFLVGSLWGDVVGSHIWGPKYRDFSGDRTAYRAARDAFAESSFVIGEGLYSIVWAIILAGLIVWAALGNRRGMFNTAVTFAGIHAYTQMFESFSDQPLAYVIGGLAAIPLAFGLWQLNNAWFKPVQVGGASGG